MKAVVLDGPERWSVVEKPIPEPATGQVLVEVQACGLCGTDGMTLSGRNTLVRYPATPGHEFVGTVRQLGEGVTRLKAGDRVAVDPSRSCGKCWHCQSGWPNLCPDKGGYGSRFPGGFAECAVVLEESCVAISQGMSWERAVLAEPLACVLHGMDRLGAVLGKRALVCGAGAIGMLTALLLEQGGAQVDVLERSENRRSHAGAWGFATGAVFDDLEVPVGGWDVVVDATGVPAVIEAAFGQVRRAGTVLLLGVAPPDERINISAYDLNWRELTVIGSMAIRHSFRRAVELLEKLDDRVESLVTHRLGLDEFGAAIEHLRKKDAMKVVIGRESGVNTRVKG